MKLRSLLFAVAVGAAASSLAACNGNNNANPLPTASPGPTCAPNLQSQLIYPNPSGTAAPDATSQIVIAVNSPLPNNQFNLQLTSGSSVAQTFNTLGQIVASQLPPGSAAATIPNPIYEAVNLVTALPAASTISVAVNDTTSTCTPNNVPGGTFNTQ